MTGFVSAQMKLLKEELRGAKAEVESCRQKYDGMFNGNSSYKGCYVLFARAIILHSTYL